MFTFNSNQYDISTSELGVLIVMSENIGESHIRKIMKRKVVIYLNIDIYILLIDLKD